MEDEQNSPWICHICDYRAPSGPSRVCSICYQTTCPSHLKTVPHYNPESKLYELRQVCLQCALEGRG